MQVPPKSTFLTPLFPFLSLMYKIFTLSFVDCNLKHRRLNLCCLFWDSLLWYGSIRRHSLNRTTLCSARVVGDKISEGSPLPCDGTSLAPVDMFRLVSFLGSSFLMGLISDWNIESSFVFVSSRYRLRALPVMDAWKRTKSEVLLERHVLGRLPFE